MNNKPVTGVFQITEQSVFMLLNSKPSVIEVCALLVISKYLDTNRGKSTAGYSVISNRIGTGPNKAIKAVNDLISNNVIKDNLRRKRKVSKSAFELYDPNSVEYAEKDPSNDKNIIFSLKPERPRRKTLRWDLGDQDLNIHYLSRSLVGDKFDLCRPLQELLRNNNKYAARLYLLMLIRAKPDGLVLYSIAIKSSVCNNKFEFSDHFIWIYKIESSYTSYYLEHIEIPEDKADKLLTEAISVLISCDLIYPCIVAGYFDSEGMLVDYFIIDYKADDLKRTSDRICIKMRNVARNDGCYFGRADDRFYDEYAVVSKPELNTQVYECYMLRHPQNSHVAKEYLNSRKANEKDMNAWLDTLLTRFPSGRSSQMDS